MFSRRFIAPFSIQNLDMQGVTPGGQVGQWAKIVPAFGTRVSEAYRRFQLGLLDGAAQMVSRRTHKFDSVKRDLPANMLDCPTCGVMETGNHVLLHCPRTVQTEGVLDHAIEGSGAAVVGTPAAHQWGGMSRASRIMHISHLLGSMELADTPTEVILRGAATQALVSGLTFVDAKPKDCASGADPRNGG